MSRIVFFSIPAYGHTNPTVEVVRQLVRRGHRVRYYSFEEFRAKLEGAGAEFVPCDTFLPPAPRDLGRRMGHDFSSLMAMVIDVTVAMEEKTLRELGEFRPDCVVADSICVWGKLYARRLGLPLVCSTTTFAFDRETAREMRPGPLEVFYTLAGLPQIGKRLALLREHGYEVEKLTELIQNDSETDTIVYTSRAFQPGGEHFGERVAFVGPSLPELPPRTQRRERPLVYVSLGTVMHGNTGFYRACAEGLGDGPWDVLLSVGSPAGAETLGALPPNVRAEARVEQLRVLGEASVFLTHCGMNSVSESIWCGVPMVLAPQQSEEGRWPGGLRSWGGAALGAPRPGGDPVRGGRGAGAEGGVPAGHRALGRRIPGRRRRGPGGGEDRGDDCAENRRGAALRAAPLLFTEFENDRDPPRASVLG